MGIEWRFELAVYDHLTVNQIDKAVLYEAVFFWQVQAYKLMF